MQFNETLADNDMALEDIECLWNGKRISWRYHPNRFGVTMMDMFIDIYELKMILNLAANSWNLTLEDEIETDCSFGCSNDGYIFENEDEMLSTKQKIYCNVKPNTHQIDKIELFHDGENRIVSCQAYKNSRPLVNFKNCAYGDNTKSEIQNFMDYWIMKNPPNKYF